MGYKQFTEIKIVNKTGDPLKIQRASHEWGKFYKPPTKDDEISPDDLNKIEIPEKGDYTVGACGRSDASSGCAGYFELRDGNMTAVEIRYESPWGTSSNVFNAKAGSNFAVNQVGGNLTSDGPLGIIQLTVFKV